MRCPLLASAVFVLAALHAQEMPAARGWLNQGVQAFKQAHYPEAIQAFQKAVDLDPSFVAARLYLATAYMQQFNPGAASSQNDEMATRARENFLMVLGSEPDNKVALASVASLALNRKNWDEAQRWYERMIAIDPNNVDGYYSLAFIAWSKWYPDDQQARARSGMRPQDPGPIPNPAIRQDLRTRYWSVLDSGIFDLQKALDINPQFEDAMSYMNLLIRGRADLLDTVDEYRRAVAEADQWVQKALETKRQKAQNSQNAARQSGAVRTEIAVPVPAQNPK